MKEGQYNRIDQDNFNDAENQYFANIEHDKDLTWEKIEERLKRKKVIPLWFYYAAASILLVFCISMIYRQSLNNKNREIAELKSKFEMQKPNAKITESPKVQYIKNDTIKIAQETVVQIPIMFHDTLKIHDTIPTVVLQKDTIIIREKTQDKKKEKKILVSNKTNENQHIENNSADLKKKRNKRFIFRFGKPKIESSTDEESGLITLRTK